MHDIPDAAQGLNKAFQVAKQFFLGLYKSEFLNGGGRCAFMAASPENLGQLRDIDFRDITARD